MPTMAQLEADIWWPREINAPGLVKLGTALCLFYDLPPSSIGIRGDGSAGHLRGYHRSRGFLINSQWATNRTYSVTETAGNRGGGDNRWCCALDFTCPTSVLLPVCKRLDAAVRAGELEKVTEWYGNLDGDTRVDGYNNIENRVASSDSSHLWHLHMSFDRGRAGDDHTDVFNILTQGGTMALWEPSIHEAVNAIVNGSVDKGYITGDEGLSEPGGSVGPARAHNLRTINERLDVLLARPTSSVVLSPADIEALAVQIAARVPKSPTADEIVDRFMARLAK